MGKKINKLIAVDTIGCAPREALQLGADHVVNAKRQDVVSTITGVQVRFVPKMPKSTSMRLSSCIAYQIQRVAVPDAGILMSSRPVADDVNIGASS